MNSLQKGVQITFVVAATVCFVALSAPKVYAQDYTGGCDSCDSGSYTDSADYTYPTDTSSYTDSADYTYPAYDAYNVYDTQDVYGNTTTDVGGVGYSEENYGTSYASGSSYGGSSYTPSFSFSAPASHYSNPAVYSAPQQQQQQQQVQSIAQAQPINIVNNNTNTNTNVNTVTPSTSTVVPIYQTPVQYPVQYTYPQNYNYQAYNYPSYTPVYTPTYVAPSPSISLSQIPYTGFDFGPVGNAMYYLSLLAFAAAGAYLLVYYSGNAMSFATAGFRTISKSRIVNAPAKLVQATAKQIEKAVEAPVLSPIQNLAVAEHGTTDSMVLTHSKDGSAPRIVITRS